jgi:CubicO group peptidase (beta-lactamase class C family)
VFVFFNGLLIGTVEPTPEIEKLEKGLLPPTLIKGHPAWKLRERMFHHKVPGVSIAVIKDFKIHWAKGFGVMDVGTKKPVSTTTLFQAASISKPVAAAAVLKNVQEGKLKLAENINNMLTGWKLPGNEFTAKNKVTIKHLLSHSGGVTVHGFRGYAVFEPVPSLIQLLDGQKPANSAAIRVDFTPGERHRYSGGGYCILQQLMIDTLKQPFPVIMEDTVIKPLGMTHSTYLQPLPEDRARWAATGHRSSGLPVKGKWHVYPEMAAAGLWTTPRDLARFAVELQLSSKNKSNKILSQKMTRLMLTPFVSDSMGLGMAVVEYGQAVYFHHSGGNEGFRCFLIAHRDNGYGAVVMTNSDNGSQLYSEITRGIANIYRWEDYLPTHYEVIRLTPEQLKPLAGKYSRDSDHMLTVTLENGRLYSRITLAEKREMFPISQTKFVRQTERMVYEFVIDPETKKVVRIVGIRNGRKPIFERKGDDYTVPLELLLTHQVDKAIEGYRELYRQNPKDSMLEGMRLLMLAEQLIYKGDLKEAMALMHLTAEFHPDLIKNLYRTLNNEIRLLLRLPDIPEPVKQQLKESYNSMLRKLGLEEID